MFKIRCRDAEPIATTSKGEPPPDPALESWLLDPRLGFAPAADDIAVLLDSVETVELDNVEASTPVGVLDDGASSGFNVDDGVDVGRTIWNEVVVAAASVLVSTATCVVVDGVVLELFVVTVTPGQSALRPRPFWKTPIMEVSPTSTPAQPLRTASCILTRP